ncbi:MAG: hypothetical protein ACLFS2_01105 [Halochromatium sp.]
MHDGEQLMVWLIGIWLFMGIVSAFWAVRKMTKSGKIGFIGQVVFLVIVVLGPIGLVLQLLLDRQTKKNG